MTKGRIAFESVPAKGLAAIEGFGEDVGPERSQARDGLPVGPTGGIRRRRAYFGGFSHRKLFCSARTWPSAAFNASFHATGGAFFPSGHAPPVRPSWKTVSFAGMSTGNSVVTGRRVSGR